MRDIDSQSDWIVIRRLAYRFEGEEGWHLVETSLSIGETKERLSAEGALVFDIRETDKRFAFCAQEQHLRLDPVEPGSLPMYDEWEFDYLANCWRAPGEPLRPIPGHPIDVTEVRVHFHAPYGGWIPISIAAGEIEHRFKISSVYDPLHGFGFWPIDLVEEEWSRFPMDVEGPYVKLLAYPASGATRVRFMVVEDGRIHYEDWDESRDDPYRQIPIDVTVNRRDLVAAFYDAFQEFWGSDRLRQNLRDWDGTDWDLETPSIYGKERLRNYRSSRVEAFLGRMPPPPGEDQG